MAELTHADEQIAGTPRRTATFFGAPIGDFGFFTSLLIGGAIGVGAFFVTTFLGIVSISIYNSSAHGKVDLADSYLRAGLPVGILVVLMAWGYLGKLWVSRITAKE
ncbi:MAG: hypothetical protein PW789_19245 [Edaphobacter sp.]|uniref:hypothetical protein n=1 Tax=Edaphobacter sp. TaxID=1934404 RepID=UPI002383CA47|nr:hypothetical protein [Edaphobacter sp.]MDE1178716.1 hypothetical protein [Edaphobacter sp.]